MKKIRSVSISSKKFPSGKYIKLIIVFLMSALVIMALILIKVYFDVNKKNMEKESSNNITMRIMEAIMALRFLMMKTVCLAWLITTGL